MTGLIILAADNSSRLGFPKQTLLYKGRTLLEISIEAGLRSKCKPVYVVLGANADVIENSIRNYTINTLYNTAWEEGMASSIRTAINMIQEIPEIDSVVIILCDQPFVSHAVINNLLYRQHQTGKEIIACSYNGITGVPALFSRRFFGDLLGLRGQEGAKTIIYSNPEDTSVIPFDKGITDIDTIGDYERLINNA